MADQRIQSFEARTENGEVVRVHVYQKMIDASTRGGVAVVPGLKYMETDAGERVQHIETGKPGRYRIVARNTILVSDDPAAP